MNSYFNARYSDVALARSSAASQKRMVFVRKIPCALLHTIAHSPQFVFPRNERTVPNAAFTEYGADMNKLIHSRPT